MLSGRIALVTGASAGIGLACAKTFAREGCRLILAARRIDQLREIAESIQAAHGVEIHTIALDVRDRAAVDAALRHLPPEWSQVDLLINNAGLSRGLEKVHEADPVDYEEMVDTNVKGLLWVTQAILPGMVKRDHGHIVNIGSIAGHQVYLGGSVYCATKAAVSSISQGLRIDLLGTRIRVSSVDPGMVQTDFSLVRFHGDEERAAKVYRSFPPLKPEDVADAILWCVTRPAHVNVAEIVLMPTDQAAVYASYQRGV